ncbi:ferritin-like domain-containing protein [Sphingosinicella sp. BN140058]|uniref:ferritin-like domain-containing protein n=1 Tax=Sphingosinicella sp. BN140058 TaxID=1892855 RepID=UPI001011BBC6|nr:ferritin-like domain-containing protein [Sphingosinicella sp. BN140058]QAY76585.1 ferritin-like domain-containing protein [Sphingosinicella sp. BN140058]
MNQTTIAQACRAVLLAAEPRDKVRAARETARAWRRGRLAHVFDVAMPDRPARPDQPELMPASRMPKRGKGGSERGRIAMLHALAHIEFAAIDLAFDMAGRFGGAFPRAFVDDWIGVGADEAMHFALLDRRLNGLGAGYGSMPAHDGLWEAAEATAHDPLARLAVVPMVLEARGLDVTPATVARFEAVGDVRSAAILMRIFTDEIRHVGVGTKWFERGCESQGLAIVSHWQQLVRTHFRGSLKPPFNDSARGQAGLSRDFYSALAVKGYV